MRTPYTLLTVLTLLSIPGLSTAQTVVPAEQSTVEGGRLLHMTTPLFPPAAKHANVNAVVTVEAVIGKDGKVTNAHALSGPQMLRWIAEDALRHWQYEPTLLDGQPVTRVAQVNFCFFHDR